MTTVLIVSSNLGLKESVKSILDLKRDLFPITCSCDFEEIIEKCSILVPDFILIDLLKDFKKGCELIQVIKKIHPESKFIAISSTNDWHSMIEAFHCGADGYLVKSGLFNELYRCICTLLLDDKYVCTVIVNEMLNYYLEAPEKGLDKSYLVMTDKERKHIIYIAEGLNSKEIAHKMNISIKTVNNYRNKIMKKLNLYSLVDIAKYAIREKLIDF
jgi:DNA-binding NarL/FixJ family response regulator